MGPGPYFWLQLGRRFTVDEVGKTMISSFHADVASTGYLAIGTRIPNPNSVRFLLPKRWSWGWGPYKETHISVRWLAKFRPLLSPGASVACLKVRSMQVDNSAISVGSTEISRCVRYLYSHGTGKSAAAIDYLEMSKSFIRSKHYTFRRQAIHRVQPEKDCPNKKT